MQQAAPERASLRFGVCHGTAWDRAEPATRDALARAAALLQEAGAIVEELALPLETLPQHHRTLMQVEGAASFLGEDALFPDALHSEFRSTVAHAPDISRNEIVSAYDEAAACRRLYDGLAAGYDAILTPSTLGEAPLGQESTGDASFNAVWTLLHVPVVHLPLFIGPHRMPVGVSLVAPRYTDRRLLDVARSTWAMTAGHRDWDPLSGAPDTAIRTRSTMPVWDDFLTEDDRKVCARRVPRKPTGLGRRPGLLVVNMRLPLWQLLQLPRRLG